MTAKSKALTQEEKELNFRRQLKIYDPEKHNTGVTIIGCGSLGSHIGDCLSKLGVKKFVLFDADKVEKHNIPNQAFTHKHVGKNKASILADIMSDNGANDIKINPKFWNIDDAITTPVVVSAADDIGVRKQVAEAVSENTFLIDVRSGTEIFDVFFCKKSIKKEFDFYKQFFFEKEETAEHDCNLQTLGYSSLVIAGLAVDGYIRYTRGDKYPQKVSGLLNQFDFETVRL